MVDLVPDIKGQKNREAALYQSEATARTLLNIPSAAIMLLDTNANLIEVNETMAKRFCMTKQEMIGMCLWNILPSQMAELRKDYFAQAVSTGAVVRWEDERQGIWGDNSCIPVLDDRGKVVQIIGFAVDITTRKLAEEELKLHRKHLEMLVDTKTAELREAKTYLENIFQTTGEAIIATDSRGYIVLANRNANELFGYSEQKFKGLHLRGCVKITWHFHELPFGLIV